MILFQKNIVDVVLNEEGVFVQTGPDYELSFDFNDSEMSDKSINTGGVEETYFADIFSWVIGVNSSKI